MWNIRCGGRFSTRAASTTPASPDTTSASTSASTTSTRSRARPRVFHTGCMRSNRETVDQPSGNLARPCLDRRLEVGHFDYWHVSTIVQQGEHIRAGQQIGWSCLGVWHVHVSEWQSFRGGRVWVNPLHNGGRLAPYTDTAPPVVHVLSFHTPPARAWMPTKSLAQPDTSTVLQPSALHGLVELRAGIDDPQSFLGFLARNPAGRRNSLLTGSRSPSGARPRAPWS